MWVNAMLTIWLWGTILSFILIGLSLWRWYLPRSYGEEEEDENQRR